MSVFSYLRSLVATFLFPFTVLILGPTAIALHFIFHNKDIDDRMVMIWGKICCRMSGVDVTVEGLENIPQGKGCLLLFNHSSFFDVFAIAGNIKGVRFGAKAELFKIPIFGKTMAAMGTLPIERKNREEVFKIYDEAKVRFQRGEQFALAPEGARFHGPVLWPFKSGPFQFAMSAGVPVIPTMILGAHQALAKSQILFNPNRWKHSIQIKILKPVSTAGYDSNNRNELIKKVYELMNPIWVEDFKSRTPANAGKMSSEVKS